MEQHLSSRTEKDTMRFPRNFPTFAMSPSRSTTTDAIDVMDQSPMNNEPLDPQSLLNQPLLAKRARASESNHNDAPRATMVNPPNPMVNKGINNIFFKTRICSKFRLGICRNGESCNFAHGIEEMRKPPPNWQKLVGLHNNEELTPRDWDEDHEIIQKMKLCKKYTNGEDCHYGERCNFLHEGSGKFRDDHMRFRESSAITIRTNESPPRSYGDGPRSPTRVLNTADLNGSKGNARSTYWKTKFCIKWETTGHCPFGEDCHFAHGHAELKVHGGRKEAEVARAISASTIANVPTLHNVSSSVHVGVTNPSTTHANEEGQQSKNYLLKLKGKKINGIYGDWLDGFPLV